jgi:non-specific serine/threonine protein kinase
MKKILIVDDDLALLETLKTFLEIENFEVFTADDGEKGFQRALQEKADLIVLDINLPVMNGYEVCRKIRAKGIMTPIIMLSGEKRDELDKALGLDIGADDYLLKPFGTKEFLARINAVLRRSGLKVEETGEYYTRTETLEIPYPALSRGSTFAGRYEVVEELGRGGMGKVYRVTDKKIGEEVALKLLNPEIVADKKTIERFRNELKFARKIAQRNVCRMFDLSEEGGTPYITMEYVDGEDLKSLLKKTGQLTIKKAIAITKQVCEGLAEAHRLGVVHRDLKPQNIMIDKEGNTRIMDFGIARSMKTKGITEAGTVFGTPEYMSPEQVEGLDVDPRSDIYSLGVILFEMVTGGVPFKGENALSVALKHKTDKAPAARELNPQIPESLNRVILVCMEKDREERYQDVEEFIADLEKLEKGETVSVRPKKEKKHKAPIKSGKEWKNSIAVLPFMDMSPEKDQEYFCDGMTEDIITKLTMFGELKVISRTSVMSYKNTDKDIKEIGQELDVATILEGSIRKEKDNIRVNAQLVNVDDDSHLWVDTYDRKVDSIFEVQDEVSKAIVEALELKLTPRKIESLKEGRPRNIEAYEYALKGMHLINSKYVISQRERDFRAAIKMFRKAKEADPDYVLTHTGLSWAYQHHNQITGNRKDLVQVKKNIEMAYKLDPDMGETNGAIAWVYHRQGEFEKAYQSYKRALEINPNIPPLNHMVAFFLKDLGLFHRAVEYSIRNIELDPFFLPSHSLRVRCLMHVGQLKNALINIKKALEIETDNFWSLLDYSILSIMKKEIGKANELLERAEKINPVYPSIRFYRALISAAKGEKDKALALSKSGVIYSLLSMKDEAVKYITNEIKKDYEHFQYTYLPLKTSPFYNSLHDDSRFQEIVKKQKKKYEERLEKFGKF